MSVKTPPIKIALMAVGDSSWQGGIQYITNIINALNSIKEEGELEIHLLKWETQVFNNLQKFNRHAIILHSIEEKIPSFTLLNRIYWFIQRKFFKRINPRYENYFIEQKFDFVYPALLSNCGGRLNSAAWIADFQYHHFPTGHSEETTKQAKLTISGIANNAKKIVLSSHFCERDAYSLFPQTKGKSFVMPFAVYIDKLHLKEQYLEEARNKYGIQGSYIMVSNLFAHTKNHKTLFEALGILRKKGKKVALVCTGNIVNYSDLGFANEVLQMLTDNGIRDQVSLLGLIPRHYQVALYRMATALVQPSINEGWSTFVEEAKALGKDLLMSDLEVHEEQYPNNPYVFRALDPSDLAQKIDKVLLNNAETHFPDLKRENSTFDKYQGEVISFGNRFLEIGSKKV
jgi:glycosyltransferase involved in cell wall biosynthesis